MTNNDRFENKPLDNNDYADEEKNASTAKTVGICIACIGTVAGVAVKAVPIVRKHGGKALKAVATAARMLKG